MGLRGPKKGEGGRPPKFSTPEELEAAIESYFESCQPKPIFFDAPDGETVMVKDARGNPVMTNATPTTAGLALHLGFAERQSLYDQKDRGENFSVVFKRAISRIFAHHEGRLSENNPTGSIFWLKNHGMSDRTEVEHSGSVRISDDVPTS
jgi:hypothetical protein